MQIIWKSKCVKYPIIVQYICQGSHLRIYRFKVIGPKETFLFKGKVMVNESISHTVEWLNYFIIGDKIDINVVKFLSIYIFFIEDVSYGINRWQIAIAQLSPIIRFKS